MWIITKTKTNTKTETKTTLASCCCDRIFDLPALASSMENRIYALLPHFMCFITNIIIVLALALALALAACKTESSALAAPFDVYRH